MVKKPISQSEMLRVAIVAMLIPAVLLIGSLVYAAFYTKGYTLFQKITVVLVALVLVAVAEAILWMVWAGSRGIMRWPKPKR